MAHHFSVITMVVAFIGMIGHATAQEATISVEVSGGDPGIGQMIVSLFGTREDYMKDPLETATIPVDGLGKALIVFAPRPYGDHAVAVIYDQDADGELDTNFLGIPKEKIGFSNNAKGRFGPASWDAVRFNADKPSVEISIEMQSVDDERRND